MEELWIPIVMFVSVATVIIALFYFRARTAADAHQTIRSALDNGQPLSVEIIESLCGPRSPISADLRRGVVFVAIGVALALFAVLLGEEDALRPLLALSAFPFSLGLAFVGLWWRGRDEP